jgi:DNA-binding transcriptional LysR family regulator
MRIDPRRLLELLAVSRHGSISAAAEALNVSQPGLSQGISQLEHGLGVRVLERGRRGATLTEFGRVLAFHARALEALLDRAREETCLHSMGVQGPLAIGITPVAGAGLVPQALGLLTQETPSVSVSVTEGLDDELLEQLRARELDLVVSRLRPGLDRLETEPLLASDWALIVNPAHPLAKRESVSLAELAQAQWVVPQGGSAFRRQMEQVFATAGVAWPLQGIATNSIVAIKAIVMNSDGLTLMSPALTEIECASGRLVAVPLSGVAPLQPVGMIWRKDDELSPIAQRFARLLRRAAAQRSLA